MAMISSRVVVMVIFMVVLFLCLTEAEVVERVGYHGIIRKIDCDRRCAVRCSRHSRPNVCTRACGTCCQRCHCVPPGTSGNRLVCGSCYVNMRTHGNRFKCP